MGAARRVGEKDARTASLMPHGRVFALRLDWRMNLESSPCADVRCVGSENPLVDASSRMPTLDADVSEDVDPRSNRGEHTP